MGFAAAGLSVMGIAAAILLLSIAFSGAFVWLGAKMAGTKRVSFVRCIMVSLAGSVVTGLTTTFLSVLPVVGTFFGLVLGIALYLFVIKVLLEVNWGQALLIWIMVFVAHIVVGAIGFVLFAGALAAALSALLAG